MAWVDSAQVVNHSGGVPGAVVECRPVACANDDNGRKGTRAGRLLYDVPGISEESHRFGEFDLRKKCSVGLCLSRSILFADLTPLHHRILLSLGGNQYLGLHR